MTERRPNPDHLLKVVSKELKQAGRGRLKICFGERIARANPGLGILLVADTPTSRDSRHFSRRSESAANTRSLVITTVACALTLCVAKWLSRYFDAPNLLALFTLTVVVVSLRLGRAAAIWGALLSVACFDFFFIPPYLTFAMSDAQYIFTFALILVMA